MKFNPETHHRRSIRLRNYDYSTPGIYFITICTLNRELYFEIYPELKQIVRARWENLSILFNHVELDEFVIMPNHIHGMIILKPFTLVLRRADARPAPTIGDIIGRFKSLCVRDWLKYIKANGMDTSGRFWQRNYYEHIVRNEEELNAIRAYVLKNPQTWHLDPENPSVNNK